jgi:hypothetical protein
VICGGLEWVFGRQFFTKSEKIIEAGHSVAGILATEWFDETGVRPLLECMSFCADLAACQV